MEWGIARALITVAQVDTTFVYDPDPRPDRESYAELGCPLVDDGMLYQHAGGVSRGEAWVGIGNENYDCTWRKPTTGQDVVLVSFGPTSMDDRFTTTGKVTNILDQSYRDRLVARMDEFEAFVGVPVVWLNWYDQPSPADRETAWTALVSTRKCWFDMGTLHLTATDFDDSIHLSPQGSLKAAGALVTAAKTCVP